MYVVIIYFYFFILSDKDQYMYKYEYIIIICILNINAVFSFHHSPNGLLIIGIVIFHILIAKSSMDSYIPYYLRNQTKYRHL